MQRIIGNRAERAERTKTKQAAADWMTAEEIGKHFHMTGDAVRIMLSELGYGCKESLKPTKEALHTGMARRFRHHGRTIFKWNRKEVMPIVVDAMKTNV